MITASRRAALFAALLALSACAVPDVGPFVDATSQVRSGLAGSGDALRLELEAMEARPEYPQPADKKDLHSRQFQAIWKVRVQSADAMLAYASSLRSITEAASHGEASGEKLAAAVEGLGQAVGIFPGGRLAAGVAADAAKIIVGQIAAIRGYSSLKESLAAANPAIQGIAGILGRDLADADGILQLAVQLQLTTSTSAIGDNLGFRNRLIAERTELYQKPKAAENEARLTEIEKQLANTDSWYQPYVKGQDALRVRLRTERQLIAKCAQAIDEWAAAHDQLTVAVRDGLGISVESLMTTAGEIRDLVTRMQQP